MAGQGKVFLIGAGFIGTEILHNLIDEGYPVEVMVRRPDHAAAIEKVGARPVMGNLEDKETILKHVEASDIVIHSATADDLPSVEAVLEAISKRANNGKETIYIHTSGAAVLADNVNGSATSDVIFSDNDRDKIDSVSDSAPHRNVDLAILKARKELGTKAKIAIMMPPLIYGKGPNSSRASLQIPALTRFALKHGFAPTIGKGAPIWSHIHVADLARAYLTILHWMEKTPSSEVLQNPYFFCENGTEFTWAQVAEEIGKALHKAGRISDPTPKTAAENQYGDLFGEGSPFALGSNSRTRADRLRSLGWEAKEKGTVESMHEDEMPALLAEK